MPSFTYCLQLRADKPLSILFSAIRFTCYQHGQMNKQILIKNALLIAREKRKFLLLLLYFHLFHRLFLLLHLIFKSTSLFSSWEYRRWNGYNKKYSRSDDALMRLKNFRLFLALFTRRILNLGRRCRKRVEKRERRNKFLNTFF